MTNKLSDWYLNLGNLTIDDVLSSVKFITSTYSSSDSILSHVIKATYDI